MAEENPVIEEVFNFIKEHEPCYFSSIYVPLESKYWVQEIVEALWYLQETKRIVLDETLNTYSIRGEQ